MNAGTCKICGCTAEAPCLMGCWWTDTTETKCSACAAAAGAAVVLLDFLRGLPATSMRVDLLTAFTDQPALEQQKIIIAVRAMVDAMHARQIDEMQAMSELEKLSAFLAEHHPKAWNEEIGATGASPIDVVMQLLGERRIVLAR